MDDSLTEPRRTVHVHTTRTRTITAVEDEEDDEYEDVIPGPPPGRNNKDKDKDSSSNSNNSNSRSRRGVIIQNLIKHRRASGGGGNKNHGKDDSGENATTTDDILQESRTDHKWSGQGILASRDDLELPKEEFAAGCNLLQACAMGDLAMMGELLKERPKHVNFRDYDRRTALHGKKKRSKCL